MEFDGEQAVERVCMMPSVRESAHDGEELVALWPLSTPLRLDNDAKYTENLQVRMTRLAAAVTTDGDVTTADAEFVYEGADSIPGRPQELVEALLDANDAYESLIPEDGTPTMPTADAIAQVADALGAGWDDNTATAVAALASSCAAYVDGQSQVRDLTWRFAVTIVLLDVMMRQVRHAFTDTLGDDEPHAGGAPEQRVHLLERGALPLVFVTQAIGETLGVPAICMTAAQWHGIVAAYATDNGDDDPADAAAVLAQVWAPLASAEWRRHREDVLWDPAEAKKRAREDDERKNKEALAAKFAHVKDDPTKQEVEL